MENTVIEVLDVEHGKKVINYWKSLGYNVNCYIGGCTRKDNCVARYYGVINNRFDNYSIDFVQLHHAKIITLPSEKTFPRIMRVYNSPESKYQRVVITSKRGMFIAWENATTFEEAEEKVATECWKYAEEINDSLEVTLKQVAEKFNVSSVKIVDK